RAPSGVSCTRTFLTLTSGGIASAAMRVSIASGINARSAWISMNDFYGFRCGSPSPLYSGERGWGRGDELCGAQTPHPQPLSPEYRGEGSLVDSARQRDFLAIPDRRPLHQIDANYVRGVGRVFEAHRRSS